MNQITTTGKGNPIASMRFRWQTFTKDTDEPMESEWEQLKSDAIRNAAAYLLRQFEKFKKDDMVVKIFNEMNSKQKPLTITLADARIIGTPEQFYAATWWTSLSPAEAMDLRNKYAPEAKMIDMGKETIVIIFNGAKKDNHYSVPKKHS